MSILVDKNTRVLCQGLGKAGTFHAIQCRDYGTQVVGGVVPGKGGTTKEDFPLFNTVADAVRKTGANATMIFVPPPAAADAIMEAADAGIAVIVAVTEAELTYAARHEQVRSLADAFRRVGVAAGPCAGAACILRAAEVVGGVLGWSASQRFDAAREFVRGAWLGRAPVLGHSGWAQEELTQGAMRGLMAGESRL